MNSSSVSRSLTVRSATGTVVGTVARCFLKLPIQERYLGLVHGSTAPSSRESEASGITRFMSKSMVLPKPWQRGQAPTDRKSTRLNSSHLGISYAVFCLKKKKTTTPRSVVDGQPSKHTPHKHPRAIS